MSEPFIGQIMMFAGTFAPTNHASCEGQLVAIQQNHALFSLLGTIFGGDGTTNFALPNMAGRAPVGTGASPFGQYYSPGDQHGFPHNQLSRDNLPKDSLAIKEKGSADDQGSDGGGTLTVQKADGSKEPSEDAYLAKNAASEFDSYSIYTTDTSQGSVDIKGVNAGGGGGGLKPGDLETEQMGNGESFAIEGPRLAVMFIIAMEGTYPQRG